MAEVNQWYRGWSSYFRMTNYPSQLQAIEANIRMRFRLQMVKNHKRKKHLVRKLRGRGIKGATAYRAVYERNQGRWRIAHDFAVHRAWNNAWFKQKGLLTKSDQAQAHWQEVKEYPQLM